jgi:DNA-binding NarL/FixJ family response regulator
MMLSVGTDQGVAEPFDTRRRRPLTDRQLAVLRLIAQGCTNNEIGRQMAVSPNTISHHIRVILQKLNARDRAHAVAIAMRESILR